MYIANQQIVPRVPNPLTISLHMYLQNYVFIPCSKLVYNECLIVFFYIPIYQFKSNHFVLKLANSSKRIVFCLCGVVKKTVTTKICHVNCNQNRGPIFAVLRSIIFVTFQISQYSSHILTSIRPILYYNWLTRQYLYSNITQKKLGKN